MQKGKFSAGAADLVRTLKKVDFPTFGTPTIPTFKFVPTRPISGFISGSAFFLGGIAATAKKGKSITKHELLNIDVANETLSESGLLLHLIAKK